MALAIAKPFVVLVSICVCTLLVTPSEKFNSAAVAVTFVPPISSVVIDTSPATVSIPSASVIKSVSSVCPIVVPLVITLSTVSVVRVPKEVIFEGSTDDGNETTLVASDPNTDRTITLPNATGTNVLQDTTDTLTNKSIDSDNNTITNIVNADIKSSAAIAFSKMADLTASRALVSDGNGDVSVSAVTSTEIGYLDGVTSAIQTQLDTKSTTAFAIAQAVALG